MLLNESYLILDNFNTLLELAETKNLSKEKVKEKINDIMDKNSSKLDEIIAKESSSIKNIKMKLEKEKINTKKLESAIESTINSNRHIIFSAVKAKDVRALKEISKKMVMSIKDVISEVVKNIPVKDIIIRLLFVFCMALFLHGFLHAYIYASFSFIWDLTSDYIGDPIYNVFHFLYSNSGDTIHKLVSSILYPIYQVFLADLFSAKTYSDLANSLMDSVNNLSIKSGNFLTNLINAVLNLMGIVVPKDVLVAIMSTLDVIINPSQYVNSAVIPT